MVTGSETAAHQPKPPTPGGDPDQPSNDIPQPPADKEGSEHINKSGFGHIGNNSEPRPEGAPPPHQIF